MPGDVDNYGAWHLSQQRNFFCKKSIQADIRKADRIEHSRARLDDSRWLVSRPLFAGDGFGDERAQAREIHEICIFEPIAARTRAGHRGICELKTCERYGWIGHSEFVRRARKNLKGQGR